MIEVEGGATARLPFTADSENGSESMDAHRFEACIGSQETSPEIEKLLADLGASGKLRATEDGYAIVRKPELGLMLTFLPVDSKSSWFKLAQVEFFSDIEDDYKPYVGVLPGGLEWSDAPDAVRRKLGPPTEQDEDLDIDFWLRGSHQLNVSYRGSMDSIASVILCVPVI